MPLYSYKCRNIQGDMTEGTIESVDADSARDALRQLNLEPESVMLAPDQEIETAVHTNWSPEPTPPSAVAEEVQTEEGDTDVHTEHMPNVYFPILETLRLYAGWVLAWYAFVYAIGFYQNTRNLPWTLPFVEGLALSPLVLSFTLAAFLFLVLTDVYGLVGRGFVKGSLLTLVGVTLFSVYRMMT